ncbi:MAG: extracellular solute-binding protein [Haliangiales bacterium]
MNELERQKRLAIADAVDAVHAGRMARREFLRLCALAGVSLGSMAAIGACRQRDPDRWRERAHGTGGAHAERVAAATASTIGADEERFLEVIGERFKGAKLVIVAEDSPSTRAAVQLTRSEFMPLTGIEVTWERFSLERVLARVSSATARESPSCDIFYLDQAWVGTFYQDTVDPKELLQKNELAYPNYNFSDLLPALVIKAASYQGQAIGIPFDIPIQILQYRRDIFEELGLAPPTTMDAYLEAVSAIHEAKAPQITGTVGQWRAGHYSLVIEAASWLWAHGGAFFGADERSCLTDEAAYASMRYMLDLGRYMPPEAMTYSWDGQARAIAEGRAAMMIGASEWLSLFDDPAHSQVVGLVEVAPCPRELALRSPLECGFDETPGISRQGGSCLAISRYSQQIDAAWVFLQWATSADVTTRASLLGGGSPIRRSNYDDPRVRAAAKVQIGTTRHFDVTLDAIEHRMGTEPHLPAWAQLVEEHLAVELGKMTTGQQNISTTLARMADASNMLSQAGRRGAR